MEETNRTYRIRTEVGSDKNITVNLEQDYDVFEILSLELTQEDTYRLQSANYGVVVGRVIANGGFGVPNAKISVFISATTETRMDTLKAQLYPFTTTRDVGHDGKRYNLLPDQDVSECHRAVGSFPSKTYVLDNDDVIEIFEQYYKYTTRTNASGDYMICGVPAGNQTVHMDLDISDCGVLSQRPRDLFYKGYTVEQFESPNVFKSDDELDSLSQIFSQDKTVNVIPFWGNSEQGDTVGISRCDINVNYKFEPTCVFIGSVFSDKSSNGISKRCVPTNTMGAMDELVTGEGTIEMIRKTPSGDVEEFKIKGTELINSDGVWCYQIPMNLDYVTTDEYGKMVPTDNPDKGIPTRTQVRFRISLHDNEENTDNYFLTKALVPNNPQTEEESDFNFGTQTKNTSFRDLFWNNVYTVKSYIPRFQESSLDSEERFSGIKHSNYYGNNNPLPYNNIRIKLPLRFTIICAITKLLMKMAGFVNNVIAIICSALCGISNAVLPTKWAEAVTTYLQSQTLVVLYGSMCPDLDGWYFAPCTQKVWGKAKHHSEYHDWNLWLQTFNALTSQTQTIVDITDNSEDGGTFVTIDEASTIFNDVKSIDVQNSGYDDENNKEPICLSRQLDYLMDCIEVNLALEYRVINFDFYNDWINGTIYLPRWNKVVKKKRNYLWGLIQIPTKIKGCLTSSNSGNGSVSFGRLRKYTQQCALSYLPPTTTSGPSVTTPLGCVGSFFQKCHGIFGHKSIDIFGGQGGVIREQKTSREQYVYYPKPCEWHSRTQNSGRVDYKVNLFATDIVLLGSLNDCDKNGIPQAFTHLVGTTYAMPTNLALTNLDKEGYLWGVDADGHDNGVSTMCSGHKNLGSYGTVEPLTAQTFANTQSFFKNTPQSNNVKYISLDDYVALTEAPGMAWNYTGPGQGKKIYDGSNAYQPGGLFLGISCFNSETNIKSCVNLSRACELGVALNPRQERVRGVKYDPVTGSTFLFNYYVPTGVISRGDILDEDFRVAFATLNNKRLIATGVDSSTGYRTYEFNYLNPVSFDGSLGDKIVNRNGVKNWYNGNLVGSATTVESTLEIPGIDYDADIAAHTNTRTLETYSVDYYKFRMGLDDWHYEKKYAKYDTKGYALPQYENSYYFYFGLHPGATAIDEFNKQYFATCKKNNDIDSSGYYYKQIDEAPSGALNYDKIPEAPNKDYPTYIRVNNMYYMLTSTEDVKPSVSFQRGVCKENYDGPGEFNATIILGMTEDELSELGGIGVIQIQYSGGYAISGHITGVEYNRNEKYYIISINIVVANHEDRGAIDVYLDTDKVNCTPLTITINRS